MKLLHTRPVTMQAEGFSGPKGLLAGTGVSMSTQKYKTFS